MVDLLARAEENDVVGPRRTGAVLRVLDGAVPFAYCVPGRVGREGRVLESTAADVLERDALGTGGGSLVEINRHAQPLPGARVQVAWAVDDGSVEVAVSDGGAPTRPYPAHASVSALGGRGLDIVEYLARTWGVRADSQGLTVWAVLPAPAGAVPEPAASSAG